MHAKRQSYTLFTRLTTWSTKYFPQSASSKCLRRQLALVGRLSVSTRPLVAQEFPLAMLGLAKSSLCQQNFALRTWLVNCRCQHGRCAAKRFSPQAIQCTAQPSITSSKAWQRATFGQQCVCQRFSLNHYTCLADSAQPWLFWDFLKQNQFSCINGIQKMSHELMSHFRASDVQNFNFPCLWCLFEVIAC